MDNERLFGQWLKQLRKSHDLTQAELANRVGYALSTIRKLESGVLRPSRHLAHRLADELHLPPEARPRFLQLAREYRGGAGNVQGQTEPWQHVDQHEYGAGTDAG